MTTWVLLRGLTRECGHWGDFPAQLAPRFPRARIIALDLPGNGALNAETSPARVEDMAASCREQLAARGVEGPYHVIAMSLGAMVGVAWGNLYPDEIPACVLINASLGGASPIHHRLRPRAWLPLLAIALSSDPRATERRVFELTSRGREAGAVLDHWAALRRTAPVSRRNALRQLVAAARYRLPEGVPEHPVLVLSSAGDRLVAPSCSHALAIRWNCFSAHHPFAGHDLPLDDGEWVAARIAEWCECCVEKISPADTPTA